MASPYSFRLNCVLFNIKKDSYIFDSGYFSSRIIFHTFDFWRLKNVLLLLMTTMLVTADSLISEREKQKYNSPQAWGPQLFYSSRSIYAALKAIGID